jgi:hypothetical protein
MSTTLYLKFPDQKTFEALLPAGFERAGETVSPLPTGITALSIIGAVYTGGSYDTEGSVLVAPTLIPGYHVNALGTLPKEWTQYAISPSTPNRVFG